MGYVPIAIEQQGGKSLTSDLKIPGFGDRVKLKDVAVFSRQFATMINSGLSLLRGAAHPRRADREQGARRGRRTRCGIDVEKGASLSQALVEAPEGRSTGCTSPW